MSRVSVRVRQADLADIPRLVALAQTLDLSSGTFSGRSLADQSAEHLTARLEEIVRGGRRTLLVAVDETADSAGKIVGLLVSRRDDLGTIDPAPVLHITHLMVTPDHRRRGVGRALLAAAVHQAEDAGIDRVLATAGASSREANRYLARLGFAPLVVQRLAPTVVLRRTLGLTDVPDRMAVLRRARLIRAQRAGGSARAARRGA